ncbi:SLAIN motif-containing protein-like isoform X2 [Eucyclogobius newberryi]|uniref:SLAIN motif-containing protein-like isoform X2 n=1 Tax=Eucyclogobius newberryi TaxID=166745 RepID=UPI003B5B12BC
MVVPDSTVPQPHSGSASCLLEAPGSSCKGAEVEGQDLELEEVRKLQELVRRLEVQNETLRNRGTKLIRGASDHTANVQERLAGNGVQSSHPSLEDRDDSSGDEMTLPVVSQIDEEDDDDDEEERGPCTGFLTLSCGGRVGQGQSQTPDSPSQESYESETLADSDSGVDQTALDEVDVLDLEEESADVDEGDSWLYVSPKKQMANAGPESPLKWCRQVLDHPSPDTEVACRTLINRLDQSTSVHSTLSSQSSIDSELSTSDDSISMGYKLQDLTDVQIMARLQEESLRQDYASSSASASRRSSTTSLHSLRRCGNCSDQEFDSYSLEDEDEFCSLPPRQHRFTPSPLGSPRCQSPSTSNHGPEHSSRLGASRTRTPRRSLQGPSAELIKFARSEEELRHSMPNLAPRTSLRSLEAVRNSRSMEANLQSSGNRMSHLSNPPSTGVTNGRIRSNGQSPLSLRTPVKAVGPMSGNHSRGLPVIQCPPAGRRVQSPSSGNGGPYVPGRTSIGTTRAGMGRGPNTASASSRSKFPQTPRRSFGISKMSDESWKDGCY